MSEALASLREIFDAARHDLPGPAGCRAEAIARFEAAGLPTRKHEDWRFTSLRAIDETRWSLPPGGGGGPHRAAPGRPPHAEL